MDLVSIIVLVNNVESFINQCLDSIVKQTYKRIEIIIVNKGSKDNTMKICEYYAKKDKRINIVNVDARSSKNKKNIGIENSKGKYITFVDGGDILADDFIEYTYNKMVDEQADIVCVNAYRNNKKKKYSKNYSVYKKNSALENYLHMNLRSNFYAKLYKKSLFNDVTYPNCEIYDDFMVTYKLYAKAEIVVNSSLNKYCVVENKRKYKDRITDQNRIKKMEACFDMLTFIETDYPKLVDYCKTKICYEAIDLFRNVTDREYRKQLYSYIKLYRRYAINDKRFDFSKKSLCIRSILGYHFMLLSFYLEKEIK